ncbi:hypothetical protein [Leptolyngbya sp. O-77]|nr:hypothetical protein [Leptolyngbya sp. O-77]
MDIGLPILDIGLPILDSECRLFIPNSVKTLGDRKGDRTTGQSPTA